MSFASPILLLGLLLLPVAGLLYVRGERRRRRAAAAFAAPATMASVAPATPGLRRHVPIALFGLALAGLLVALARPQATVAVPVERASVVLVIDHSGSMQATDVQPSRLAAAQRSSERFLDRMPRQVRVGLVAFDHRAKALESPTTDRLAVRDALRSLRPSGATATGDAMATALGMLQAQADRAGRRPPSAIVLLSDGASTRGRPPLEVADQAAKLKIPVYTVALGTPEGTIEAPAGNGRTTTKRVPPDERTLAEIASRTNGQAFTAEDAEALQAVYERLGSQVATKDEKREITAAFAGGALAVLAAGALLSLGWFRRLI